MKRKKEAFIAIIALTLFAVGLIMAFFCTEAWQRVLGLAIAAINVIVAIDFMSDSLQEVG